MEANQTKQIFAVASAFFAVLSHNRVLSPVFPQSPLPSPFSVLKVPNVPRVSVWILKFTEMVRLTHA